MKTAERFIKKQVTVEAIQFNGNSNRAGIELFVGKELKTELESETAYIAGHGAPIFSLLIETKEGVMKAFKNDWIIKEPFPTGDRDFYPCKSDIFEKTYSPLASHPSPMSAEQVEELADKYASEEFDKHSFSEFKGAENSLWENRKADFIAGYNAATTPSVKADGWVSVDKEKEFHKVLKCLKNNKVMVGTREDGIYIRLAGRESEGEAFTLHFALAYPFPKLPPHQNKNK